MNPNVLFITIDSLRADHVSCISDSHVETPAIDRLGRKGTVFTDAIAQGPFTTFSMPSLFTARYPSGLTFKSFSDSVVGVYPKGGRTLPEAISEHGYETAGFHSNPLLSELFDFDRGFDAFDADLPFASLSLPGRFQLLTNKLRRLLRAHAYIPAASIADRAIQWADSRSSEQPFFLWTHFMDVHGPYQQKEGFVYYNKFRSERLWKKAVHSPSEIAEDDHRELVETYAEEIEYTDEHIGRLIDHVSEESDRPTLVVITADHGEGFAEHGYYSHPHRVEDVLLNVPLVISDPTDTVESGVVSEPTELIDLAPTILDIVGAEIPTSFEGRALTPSTEVPESNVAVGEANVIPEYTAAFVTRDWKYIIDEAADTEMLFERSEGENEGRRIDDESHDQFHHFREISDAHRDRNAATVDERTESAIEDEEVRDRLKRLGYMK